MVWDDIVSVGGKVKSGIVRYVIDDRMGIANRLIGDPPRTLSARKERRGGRVEENCLSIKDDKVEVH